MCCDGKGRGEGNLPPFDFEQGALPPAVQIPIFRPWADGIHARLIDAIQLPGCAFKLDIDASW